MIPIVERFLFGLIFSTLIGLLAYWRKSLTRSGVLGAMIVGTSIFTFGGPAFGMILIAFFVLSSLLSRFKREQKETVAAEKFDKSDQRDLGQALANGGVASLLSVLYFLSPTSAVLGAFVAAVAVANSDTWATELGVLSKHTPRSILNFKPVVQGTSGGVTPSGTLAALAGAGVIGLIAAALLGLEARLFATVFPAMGLGVALVGLFGGFVGSLIDSVLGATLQVMYRSSETGAETERELAADGTPNQVIRGLPWLNNDWVNFVSIVAGAAVGAVLSTLLFR